MVRLDASTAELSVLTYKEGLLSPVAHDLHIRVESFALEIETGATPSVRLRVDPGSLRVVSAMRGGRPAPGLLSASDARKIERTIAEDVLEVRRYPELRFDSESVVPEGGAYAVGGTLELHGTRRAVDSRAELHGADWAVEVVLHQPDFGIRPYSAMFGTLRIKPDVRVHLRIPRSLLEPPS